MTDDPKSEQKPRPRGLKAVDDHRAGRTKTRWPATRFWAYAGIIIALALVFNWRWGQSRTESARQALLARQRAVATEFGQKWLPLRDQLEAWVVELAKDPGAEVVDKETLSKWDFRPKPGVYLRARTDLVGDPAAIRKVAKESLRDAFTTCLLRASNPVPTAGKECKKTRECELGQICNENDRCSLPSQPYNLRVAYRALQVLSDEWMKDVQVANELGLRALTTAFDDANADDFPVAADLLRRAEYFLLVLDEPSDAVPKDTPKTGPAATEALLAVPHFARIGLFRLSDGKLVLRLRREASGQLLGTTGDLDGESRAALARQTNSCGLALEVRNAMGDANVPSGPPKLDEPPKPAPSP